MSVRTFLLAAVAAAPAFADDTPARLEPVVVTATRSPQSGNRLPASMTVITRDDLAQSGAQNVADALRTVAGVQLTDFFGDGSQYTTVDLRGFGLAAEGNVAILIDGRRLNNVDIAPPDLSAISLKDVERIEIVQGSAGTLYGDQAVGGVINIVTRDAGPLALDASAGIGSYGGQHGEMQLSQHLGDFSYRLSGASRGSDNYRNSNHHENENLLGRAGYDYDGGSAFLEGGYVNDRVQLPGALTAAEMSQDPRQCEASQCGNYSNSGTAFQRANWTQSLFAEWQLETDLTRRRGNGSNQLTFFGSRSRFTQSRKDWSLNPRLAGRIALPAGMALITTGVDAQLAEYTLVSQFGQQSDRQRQRDFYAQGVLPLTQGVDVIVGARAARVDDRLYDGVTFATPSPRHDTATAWEAGLAWMPLDTLRVHARHDGNFRFAKADEFFSYSNLFPTPTPGQVNLRTQTGHTYEVGADWTAAPVDLHANLYDLELKNEISFDPATFTNVNLDRTRREGATLDAGWRPLNLVRLSLGGQYLRARFASGPSAGKDVPLAARRTGRAAVTAFLPWQSTASLELLAVSRRPFDGDYANAAGSLAGHGTVNFALQQEWGRWHADVRLNNLLGRRYAEYGVLDFTGTPNFYPSPDLNFWLNVGATL